MSTVKEPMKRKEYEKALRKLQVELCALQDWVKEKGQRVVVIFEGRDAAGKGGTIKAITERVSPRVFRVVALPAPSDREKSQLYFQLCRPHPYHEDVVCPPIRTELRSAPRRRSLRNRRYYENHLVTGCGDTSRGRSPDGGATR
jgi:Polyphosphate kinase 2 (PPK2)